MRRIKCVFLVLFMLASTALCVSADMDDNDLSNYLSFYGDSESGTKISLEMPLLADMELVADNGRLSLYYYQDGADVYLINNATGKIWSNVLQKSYVYNEKNSSMYASQLLTVSAADYEGSVRDYVLYDSANTDIRATSLIQAGKLQLMIEIPSLEISFKVIFGIENDAFYYRIEDSSISEKNGKLVQISLLNNLGASRTDEDGYIFYPDGSGAIMNFKENDESNVQLYQMSIYGSSDVTYSEIDKNKESNIYGNLLPVYGVSQHDGGFVAVVSGGDEDAGLYIASPGYQLSQVYRSYITFRYRTYSSTVFNDSELTQLVDKRTKTDREVFYYFLDGQDNSYSGMAVRYRKHLIDHGILTKRKGSEDYFLNIKLLCGVQKQSLFFNSVYKMTGFSDAMSIAKELKDDGIDRMNLALSGWGKGGWDALPTNLKAEGKLGGAGGLNKLAEYCSSENIPLSLDVDAIMADERTGKFNKRTNAVRNYFGESLTDKNGDRYILDACDVMPRLLKSFHKAHQGTGINLLTVGELVIPDCRNGDVSTRADIINAYSGFMKEAAKAGTRLTTEVGNAYILPYTDMIYGLPGNDSGYMISDRGVPFYQMVVHGYIPYTGQFGNTHYSYERCVLEWIETGSLPSYLLTKENSGRLENTDYDEVFSSEFVVWKEPVVKTYEKLYHDFSALQGLTIDRHEQLSGNVVRVAYSDGTQVYINYGEEAVTVDGVDVAGLDYSIKREVLQ